jgi:polyhydroxybutyrate depolymerase
MQPRHLGLLLLLTACSGDADKATPNAELPPSDSANDSTSDESSSAAPPPATPDDAAAPPGAPADRSRGPSAGCSVTGKPTGASKRTLTVAGKERSYLLAVPGTYVPDKPLALVFGMHTTGVTGADARADFGLEAPAKGGAIFVYPTALASKAPELDGANRWDFAKESDDLKFVDAILNQVEGDYCIERARVFATGFSSGGRMAALLGCYRGDVIRATAPVAPGGEDAPLAGCTGATRGNVAVWEAWGSKDAMHESSGKAVRDYYLAANGCQKTTAPATPSACVTYAGCREGLPVQWCVHDGAHVWPSFAGAAMWKFFDALK